MTLEETIEYLNGKEYYSGLSLLNFNNLKVINSEIFDADIIITGIAYEVRLNFSDNDQYVIRGKTIPTLPWMYGKLIISNNDKSITFSSQSAIKKYYELSKIDISKYTKTEKEDIYIISLRYFKDNLENGITFRDYINFVNSVYVNSFKKYQLYGRLFDQITGIKHSSNEDLKTFASIESIFRLLEYEELQLATQQATAANIQAKEAKIESNKALKIAMASLIAAVVFAVIQLAYQGWHDITEDADNNTKYGQIMDLMKQNNKKDTIIVHVTAPAVK